MKNLRIALSMCLPIAAAAQAPAFDVASVKPSNYQGGPLRVTAGVKADGIDFSNVTPRLCIQRAYGVKMYQLTGPEWINTERYMIVAKAARAAPESQILLMLQRLLADGFKLTLHHESREMPAYTLVVGRSGPKMKEATDEGATEIGPDGEGSAFRRVSMELLAGTIARSLECPVIDATGLKGLYNFRLAWANGRGGANDDSDAPSIFSAVQDLGLKLEARKTSVDVLVIDHIEKPSAN
jgi:uncharacterized protein (TIGR03435 family)